MPSHAERYGTKHRELRAYWAEQIKAGVNPICSLCPHPIIPTDLWDLDHDDDGVNYRGPAHQDCNRRAGAVKKNKLYAKAKTTTINRASRNW